jgi:hypothetical protein
MGMLGQDKVLGGTDGLGACDALLPPIPCPHPVSPSRSRRAAARALQVGQNQPHNADGLAWIASGSMAWG